MKITSQEIKQQEFERSFRGYNIEEVGHFLDTMAVEWDRMTNEMKMLRMQLDIAEKDASKLKEMEGTLIKALKTTEDNRIKVANTAQLEADQKIGAAEAQAQATLESANQNAIKIVNQAKSEASTLVNNAQNKADNILKEAEGKSRLLIEEAESKAKDIQEASKLEIAELDQKYNALEAKKNHILRELKDYSLELNKIVDGADLNIEKDEEEAEEIHEIQIETVTEEPEIEKEEEEEITTGISIPSSINKITEEPVEVEPDDLEIIEGIGPKIKEVLSDAGIKSYRSLAITPEYRLRAILTDAGPHFAIHDPGTWNEQALLAANGEWEKLEDFKKVLIAGRLPEEESQITEEIPTSTDGSNADEMLDKVNKVKAAIRKAMAQSSTTPKEPSKPESSGSFFDNL